MLLLLFCRTILFYFIYNTKTPPLTTDVFVASPVKNGHKALNVTSANGKPLDCLGLLLSVASWGRTSGPWAGS